MSGRHVELWSGAIGANGAVVAYGHYGRPVLAFPAERGGAWEYADRGMIGALDELLAGGRVKLYCVESFDSASWSSTSIPLVADPRLVAAVLLRAGLVPAHEHERFRGLIGQWIRERGATATLSV